MEATCKTCGEVFSYEKVGPGRLRRYCDLCSQPQHNNAINQVTCECCGATFTVQRWNAKYCQTCKPVMRAAAAKQSRENAKQNGTMIVVPESKWCKRCNQVKPASDFVPQRDRPNGLSGWCRACKNADQKAKHPSRDNVPNGDYCEVCGAELVGQQLRLCSPECRVEDRRLQARARGIVSKEKTYTCKECGVTFTPQYGDKKRVFCSYKCTRKNARRKQGKPNGSINQVSRKRLGKIHGAKWSGLYEPIKKRVVFERDDWRCQICGIKVEIVQEWQPYQATIDHVFPIALGGSHTYDNVQTACSMCNSSKGCKIQ